MSDYRNEVEMAKEAAEEYRLSLTLDAHNPRDDGCKCSQCGRRYKVDFLVPDDLWAKISKGHELLCGHCIVQALERLGFVAFNVREVP